MPDVDAAQRAAADRAKLGAQATLALGEFGMIVRARPPARSEIGLDPRDQGIEIGFFAHAANVARRPRLCKPDVIAGAHCPNFYRPRDSAGAN